MRALFFGLCSVILASFGCAHEVPRAECPSRACFADRIPPPDRAVPFAYYESSCASRTEACEESCRGGDPNACFARGRLHQVAGDAEAADLFFELACERGSMLGCTNRAAGILLAAPPTDDCLARVFERTCAAGEPWGCGMLGVVLVQGWGVPRDAERGRRVLTEACTATEHPYACSELANALEQGLFGTRDPRTARRYRELACRGGDQEACSVLAGR
jgi:TPR repeat protein